MRNVVAVRSNTQVARPLKTLVPLIKDELTAGDEAGLTHYRRAGEMLNEVRDSEQVPYGSWGQWLSKNFRLSSKTAHRYMQLARLPASVARDKTSLSDAIGEKPSRSTWKPIFEAADRVNVTRLADERQSRDNEVKLHRELALKLIDLGYRAMATRLHPDRGGSRDAMGRLNLVRDELKSIAATRRFI